MDDLETVAEAATDEAVLTEQETEATETTETVEAETPEQAEEKTKSQLRREQRKQREQRLMEQAQTAEQRAREAEQRLERIRKSAQSVKEPTEAEISDPFELGAARALWKQTRGQAEMAAKEVSEELTAHTQQVQQVNQERLAMLREEFEAAAADARTRYPDFDVARAIAAENTSVAVSHMVVESENSAELAYHLGKNPALAQELSKMPPLAAAREIGKLEAMLSAPKPKLVSTSPAPISPVTPSGTVAKSPANMSFAEFKAWREGGGTITPR
jgi:hypothetical protein